MDNDRHSHFHIIPQDKAPELLNLIVEIEKGTMIKYEYNHKYGILELDRILYGPTQYPVNYCNVPCTWNQDDNDPLDAILYCSGNLVPGTLASGRVVGMMEMIDNGEKDHKILCVADKDPRYGHIKTLEDLTPYELKDVKTFMEIYKIPQTGPKTVQVGDFLGLKEAYRFIENGIEYYKEKFINK
ncbi:MAG: inorganic diphosphatase [Patescibacteria group bacterium]|jgi:inorganic pyrophosphatase